jgi:hypothetical protein
MSVGHGAHLVTKGMEDTVMVEKKLGRTDILSFFTMVSIRQL